MFVEGASKWLPVYDDEDDTTALSGFEDVPSDEDDGDKANQLKECKSNQSDGQDVRYGGGDDDDYDNDGDDYDDDSVSISSVPNTLSPVVTKRTGVIPSDPIELELNDWHKKSDIDANGGSADVPITPVEGVAATSDDKIAEPDVFPLSSAVASPPVGTDNHSQISPTLEAKPVESPKVPSQVSMWYERDGGAANHVILENHVKKGKYNPLCICYYYKCDMWED